VPESSALRTASSHPERQVVIPSEAVVILSEAVVIPSEAVVILSEAKDLLLNTLHAELVHDFAAFGVTAFTTTRAFGTLSAASDEPTSVVSKRWDALREAARAAGVERFATANQVHGRNVLTHRLGWRGWLRGVDADGHFTPTRDTALAVTIADCVPVFMAHPSGATALLHSGWRGTEARIVEEGIATFTARGFAAPDLRVHLGPAICGKCYEVSAEVAAKLLGTPQTAARTVDLRAIIAEHARALGVRSITSSPHCTKCDNNRFFSHRAADPGRQAAVIIPALALA
jgi:YfiH family protein